MSKMEPWLLLMHQIPPKPDSLRVRVWRSLQKIGALQLKSSVYVLPAGKENEKRFEAVLQEIVAGKGDAFLCRSEFIQGIEGDELIDGFNEDRAQRYQSLSEELRGLQKLIHKARPSENDLMAIEHSLGKVERQLNEVKAIDFFDCRESKPVFKLLESILARVESLRSGSEPKVTKKDVRTFQNKTWVTRSNIHVDRLASAWLIAKFIDRKAKFKFVNQNNYQPKKDELRFDMFEGEFTHVSDKCTIEVLRESFSLKEKSIAAISEIIHDLDLKDSKYNRPETSGIGMVIKGIVSAEDSDEKRMKRAFDLFDELNKSLAEARR